MPLPIEPRGLKVRSLSVDLNELTWSVDTSMEDVLDYRFFILRSESPEGPFDNLTPQGFTDRFLFIDKQLPKAHRWRSLFYRIRTLRVQTGETAETASVQLEPEADLVASSIRNDLQLLYREFAGRRCWVLPVRTFGARCSCWSTTLQKQTRSRCITCFDTGFIRGYMSPIEAFVDIDPSPKTEQVLNVGTVQQVNTTARMAYYPPLKPRDIIVEGENRRWRVVKQAQTEHGRARLQQLLELHEIPTTDVEYRIPLNMDEALKDIFFSPARNFTNPHNLDNFQGEEIPSAYTLYPTTYPDKV